MANITLEEDDIPHGHGLSFKKGVSDGLLDQTTHEGDYHSTHDHSYRRGVEAGRSLRTQIGGVVKD